MEHGGKREGAGRKSKAEEQKLVELLTPVEPTAHKALLNGLENDESWAVKLFFEYMYGKPKQIIEASVTQNNPIFKGIDLNVRTDDSTV